MLLEKTVATVADSDGSCKCRFDGIQFGGRKRTIHYHPYTYQRMGAVANGLLCDILDSQTFYKTNSHV